MDLEQVHLRTREHGVNLAVYAIVRVLFQTFFHLYFRMRRIGREHIPSSGPVIVASNHRSFLDPFVIACMARRPMYYVAKKEIFLFHPLLSWILGALGAFPVDRGAGDAESVSTAKAILARGDIVLIFPEGTRTRPGALGIAKRGVGRLALETGAPVVPVAVVGTEAVRNGWRIRPHKVRIRAGRPLRFPRVEHPSVALAGAVTDRIWPCVMLQWEWLGGVAPMRRAAVIGSGAQGKQLALCLARAGLEVSDELDGGTYDLVCLALPAAALPSVLADCGDRIPRGAGLLVVCDGLVPPLGTLPSAFASEHCHARAVAVLGGLGAAEALVPGASVVLASLDRGLARQLAEALRASELDVSITSDVTGVELASRAQNAAALAAIAAARAGASVAGAAAGKVFAEVGALARARGGRPETFSGVAGAGALLATVMSAQADHPSPGSWPGVTPGATEQNDEVAAAAESIPLLAAAARRAHLPSPALDGLAALIEGRIEPDRWAAAVVGTTPP